MYKLGTTKRFDKALKLCRKRGYPIEKLQKAIYLLVENAKPPGLAANVQLSPSGE